jgi:hypothetical protein
MRKLIRLAALVAFCSSFTGAAPSTSRAIGADDVSFLRDIAPIVTTRCAGCHGDKKAEGDYRLHTFEYLLLAGASGDAAVVPGKPAESALLARLLDPDPATRMPQEDDPLSKEEIELVRRWIAGGAKFDGVDRKGSIKAQLPLRKHAAAPETYAHPMPVYALDWAPNGELAVAGLHEVTVWSAEGKLLRRLGGLPLRIHALKYDRAGKRLLVGGGSPGDFGELSLVDPSGKTAPKVLGVFDDLVLGVAWSRDETRVAGASADRSVRVYGAADGKHLWTSRLHSDFATAVSFRDDDKFVATAGKDCTVKVLDAATGRLFTTFNGHQMNLGAEPGRHAVADVAFVPGGPQAVSAGEGRSVRLWEPEKAQAESGDAGDMESRFATQAHTQYLPHLSNRAATKLAVVGSQLFIATGDGPVRHYDLSKVKRGTPAKEEPPLLGAPLWTYSLAVSSTDSSKVDPTTLRVAAGSHDGTVRVWDAATQRLLATFTASPAAAAPSTARK